IVRRHWAVAWLETAAGLLNIVQPLQSLCDDFEKSLQLGLVADWTGSNSKHHHRIPGLAINGNVDPLSGAAIYLRQVFEDHGLKFFGGFRLFGVFRFVHDTSRGRLARG